MDIKSVTPSQKFVEVKEIKDNIAILKNGGLKAISIASSVNFELKSADEQKAIIGRFQSFLNSLDFPIQILVSSRALNIDSYLEQIRQLAKVQENELLHAQTLEYIDFIERFVELTDIMNKSFYIVLSYNPTGIKQEKITDKIKQVIQPLIKSKKTEPGISQEKFKQYKDQLMQRVSHVSTGLKSLGIKTTLLNNKQITRLFYEFYNPSN